MPAQLHEGESDQGEDGEFDGITLVAESPREQAEQHGAAAFSHLSTICSRSVLVLDNSCICSV